MQLETITSYVCIIGWNDFEFFWKWRRRTLWWILDRILRHFYKIRFLIFWAVSGAFAKKFAKSANMTPTSFKKVQYGYQKTQNLVLISNPLKKLQTFLWSVFCFFNGFEISIKFCVFLYPYWIFLGYISTFCKLFANALKRFKFSKIVFCENI